MNIIEPHITSEIKKMPFVIDYDINSKKVTLRNAKYFPQELYNFSNHIDILDASNCNLRSLPDNFANLNPKIVFLSNNPIEKTPQVLSECSDLYMVAFKSCQINEFCEDSLPLGLKWLIMTDNPNMKTLPKSIGKLSQLEKVALTQTGLEKLPDEMQNCEKMALLRISVNNMYTPTPSWVFEMPNLAWFTDSANPFSYTPNLDNIDIKNVLLNDINISDEILGESPSSKVYSGSIGKLNENVAIKLYKNGITSDGLPIDDLIAYVLSNKHENLIEVIANIKDENQKGLVLKLIDSNEFGNLGNVPNFETISRDSFPSDLNFQYSFILNVLKGVSSACSHIHSKGINHGDIYAHNILVNNKGHAYLHDFGAASFYDINKKNKRELIDVKAFGYLIDDLIMNSSKKGQLLERIRNNCLNPIVNERPTFNEIENEISSLK